MKVNEDPFALVASQQPPSDPHIVGSCYLNINSLDLVLRWVPVASRVVLRSMCSPRNVWIRRDLPGMYSSLF